MVEEVDGALVLGAEPLVDEQGFCVEVEVGRGFGGGGSSV